MKTITFIRHAKSDWNFPELKDINRPLNKRGLRDAPEMGKRIRKMNLLPEIVFLSPSQRTIQTMDLLSPEAGWGGLEKRIEDWMYPATVSGYLGFIESLNPEVNNIVFCGHNPTITDIVTYLSGQYISNVPTCGMAIINFEVADWNLVSGNAGNLIHYDYPKNH